MSKKYQLEHSSRSDTGVVGILSHLPDYRLVHFLNKELNFKLVKMPDMNIAGGSKGDSGQHPFYLWVDDVYDITFCLIGNRGTTQPLIPLLKNIDFLLFMIDLTDRYGTNELVKRVRSISGVSMVQWIETEKVPKFAEIVGLVELHITAVRDQKQ